MRPRLIRANSYRRERWRNDLGWTREIVRYPEDEDALKESPHTDVRALADGPAFSFRMSIAEIEHDCAFSLFPGCDRHLVLLSGHGMTLEFEDGESIAVRPPHGRVAFAGERALHCRLQDGPTHDLNVMVRRDRWSAQVFHRPLVGSMVFFNETGVSWAIYLLSGGARIKANDMMLAPGDTVLLEPDPGASAARQILDGAGEALLVRLQRIHHALPQGG